MLTEAQFIELETSFNAAPPPSNNHIFFHANQLFKMKKILLITLKMN